MPPVMLHFSIQTCYCCHCVRAEGESSEIVEMVNEELLMLTIGCLVKNIHMFLYNEQHIMSFTILAYIMQSC